MSGKRHSESTLKSGARWVFAISMIAVGLSHFYALPFFMAIVPPWLPMPELMIYISGVFEILGGVGLLVPATRRFSGWGLVALFVAVYPVNIHMLVNDVYPPDVTPNRLLLWARMPIQAIFVVWALWVANIWPRTQSSLAQTTAEEANR